MMAVPAIAGSKQAEEQKDIADTDTILLQMRLGRARLPEGPAPIREYGIFVAEIVGTNAPFGRVLDDLPAPGPLQCITPQVGFCSVFEALA